MIEIQEFDSLHLPLGLIMPVLAPISILDSIAGVPSGRLFGLTSSLEGWVESLNKGVDKLIYVVDSLDALAHFISLDIPADRVGLDLSAIKLESPLLAQVKCSLVITLVETTQFGDIPVYRRSPTASRPIFSQNDSIESVVSHAWTLLKCDRPDSLIPTIVADEQGIALGLCYSNLESFGTAIKKSKGVYWSRNRGLWEKGLTSGASQILKRIDWDCDEDTLRFTVVQNNPGFCHLNTRTCFGPAPPLSSLYHLLVDRLENAPTGSYTKRLFQEPNLLESKIREEAQELCDAKSKDDIAWEAADLIYFALVKCVSNGVSLADVEAQLDSRSKKVTRRPGNAKPEFVKDSSSSSEKAKSAKQSSSIVEESSVELDFTMKQVTLNSLSRKSIYRDIQRPLIKTDEIMGRVRPIVEQVRAKGDQAIIELTKKFDSVQMTETVLRAPFDPKLMQISDPVKKAIDIAYANIEKFHQAQYKAEDLVVETMPGIICSRVLRPIERVGLYVPGGSAVLPSTALMLGIPAKVAGCREIVMATPPRKDGSICPEVLYVAHRVGATVVLKAGGAQAVAAMAFGTESVPKVDKICGPGNQYVTAAKMIVQSDSSALVSIDMPAGPSELLVVADKSSNPAYLASDLLSQAEHGEDSQVVLVCVDLTKDQVDAIQKELKAQASVLPRSSIVRVSISKSWIVLVSSMTDAIAFSNHYAPEHLILNVLNAEKYMDQIQNAGSVFLGPYSAESCGDYASGTNHTLPTYGYARMYSGVNTNTFLKHITSQSLTSQGLDLIGDAVTTLAEIEGLEAHRNAVAIRLRDIRK